MNKLWSKSVLREVWMKVIWRIANTFDTRQKKKNTLFTYLAISQFSKNNIKCLYTNATTSPLVNPLVDVRVQLKTFCACTNAIVLQLLTIPFPWENAWLRMWMGEVTDGLMVRAGISVTWTVLSWSGGHEFEHRSDCRVELGVRGTSVPSRTWTKIINKGIQCHVWPCVTNCFLILF